MSRTIMIAAAAAATSLFAVQSASAAPIGANTAGSATDGGLVQKVHDGNTHRACLLGPGGWHYHSRFRGRVACRPPSPGKLWMWRKFEGREGWWHPREHRWWN